MASPGTLASQMSRDTDGGARAKNDADRDAKENYAVLARTVGEVSAAVAVTDLQGRTSFAAPGTDSDSWTSTQAADYAFGPALNLTLDRARVVSVSYQVNVEATVWTGSGSSARAFIGAGIKIDGANPVGGQSSGGYGCYQNASAESAGALGSATARCIVTLAAGTHTIRGVLSERKAEAAGDGFAAVFAYSPYLIVDVMQPA
jgi:hypothetical protein